MANTQLNIEVPNCSTLEASATKVMLEKIARNFDKKNLAKIAELSEIKDANNKLQGLFNNPLFKMAIK